MASLIPALRPYLLSLTAVALAIVLLGSVSHPIAAQTPSPDSSAANARPLTAVEQRAFVGRYRITLPENGRQSYFDVHELDAELSGQLEGQEPVRLRYLGDNSFSPRGIRDFVFRFELEGGRATKFTVRRDDGVMEGVRVP